MLNDTYKLIAFSANSEDELDEITEVLCEETKRSLYAGDALNQFCESYQTGKYRRGAVVKTNGFDIRNIEWSNNILPDNMEDREISFLFGGQGAFYKGMGKNLYNDIPFIKDKFNNCLDYLNSEDRMIFEILLKYQGDESIPGFFNIEPRISQLFVFTLEYVLSKYFIELGLKPTIMLGYSLGEYVGAAVSGAMELKDIYDVLVKREGLLHKIPVGKMLSVPVSKEKLDSYLVEDTYLAINNGSSCVVSGTEQAIFELKRKLENNKILSILLNVNYPLHSKIVESVVPEFNEFFKHNNFSVNNPDIPFISNITGEIVDVDELKKYNYWSKHMSKAVNFDRGLDFISQINNIDFIEIGVGKDIGMLLFRYINGARDRYYSTIRYESQEINDVFLLNKTILKLYLKGYNFKLQLMN